MKVNGKPVVFPWAQLEPTTRLAMRDGKLIQLWFCRETGCCEWREIPDFKEIEYAK